MPTIQTPDRKVSLGAGIGGLMAGIVWAVQEFGGIVIPAEAASGLTVAIMAVAQYFIRNK